jgi:hypothetical protein
MASATTQTATGRRHRRCHSWRPVVDTPHNPEHAPGECRACWRPCFRKTTDGALRCDECTDALLTHHATTVRIALAGEPDIPLEELRVLATDANEFVAIAARWSLERRLPGQHRYVRRGGGDRADRCPRVLRAAQRHEHGRPSTPAGGPRREPVDQTFDIVMSGAPRQWRFHDPVRHDHPRAAPLPAASN